MQDTIDDRLDKLQTRIEIVSKGVSNTIDSHRKELNSFSKRLNKIEQTEAVAAGKEVVLVVVAGLLFTVAVGIVLDHVALKHMVTEYIRIHK